jgi:D-glycero-alpha-D-manno-heptose-7-phosphate kinase
LIIARAPTRLPLGGGGTDLASYYSKFGGFFVSAAIDKFNYIAVKPRFEEGYRVSYSKTEITDTIEEIQQPIIREALLLLGVRESLEIVSIADVPGRSGLGGSSSYAVGVLNALHARGRNHAQPGELAEEACYIEIERLREPIGKQDQYVAAFGGINSYEIDTDGEVQVEPIPISPHVEAELESNILLFFTGIKRDASTILSEIKQNEIKGAGQVVDTMHKIKDIGYQVRDALVASDLTRFGELLDTHWQTKKNLSGEVSNFRVDELYDIAKRNGAIGGKIMGAGGGGFFMFYSDAEKKAKLREAMVREKLKEVRFRVDHEGSKITLNM